MLQDGENEINYSTFQIWVIPPPWVSSQYYAPMNYVGNHWGVKVKQRATDGLYMACPYLIQSLM